MSGMPVRSGEQRGISVPQPSSSGAHGIDQYPTITRKEDLNKIMLLEKRLGLQPFTPHGADSQLGSSATGGDAGVRSSKSGSDSGSDHLVSDTPVHSTGLELIDGNSHVLEKRMGQKKRRVQKVPKKLGSQQQTKHSPSIGAKHVVHVSPVDSKGIQAINRIDKYFTLSKSVQSGEEISAKEGDEDGTSLPRKHSSVNTIRHLKLESESLREENAHLQAELKKTQEACDHLENTVASLEKKAAESKNSNALHSTALKEFVARLAKDNARKDRTLSHHRLQEEAPRLGTLSVQRKGIDVQEVWENGSAIKNLKEKYDGLMKQKESIETLRKATKRRLPLPGQPLPQRMDTVEGACSDSGPLHPDDWLLQEEALKVRLASIRRDEDALKTEGQRLELEKNIHIREIKRLRDEEASRFGDNPVLHGRYLLLELLGKGGFSEVFKSLDLQDFKHVAVKIHQLSSQWSESKKASYVKHSVREYHIHKQLHHPRIVGLLDIFEIDNNTFATVLEYCSGGDLDGYVKAHEILPEKEAKSITAQILSALCYLNVKPRSFIHYDLKPANILFDAIGQVKITDFGLSKVVEDGHTQGMELTSQGAGTYWYLPPECFDVNKTPLISNKVDVWSVGVILYQMVYGKRPFGHDLTQEQILRNDVMLNAKEVQFPSRPSASSDCKDFIRKCLEYRQEDRLDVHEAASHPFLAAKRKL